MTQAVLILHTGVLLGRKVGLSLWHVMISSRRLIIPSASFLFLGLSMLVMLGFVSLLILLIAYTKVASANNAAPMEEQHHKIDLKRSYRSFSCLPVYEKLIIFMI